MKFLLLLLILFSCSKHEDSEPIQDVTLEKKAKLYCDLSKPLYDKQKWVVEECDGAGFTALYAIACKSNNVDLSVFQDKDGKMFRNPNKNCYPKHSDSEFSKDHVLMSMAAWHELKLIGMAKKFKNFVDDNNLKFCEGKDQATTLSRCYISPSLYFSLSEISKESGKLAESEDVIGVKDGFEGHLDVVNIWLTGRIHGKINDLQKNRLKKYAEKEKENALFQAVAFRYGVTSIENVNKAFFAPRFPNDRLPTNTEYCTEYLFQRDMDAKDWKPCTEKKLHSGTDFAFAYYVLSK